MKKRNKLWVSIVKNNGSTVWEYEYIIYFLFNYSFYLFAIEINDDKIGIYFPTAMFLSYLHSIKTDKSKEILIH